MNANLENRVPPREWLEPEPLPADLPALHESSLLTEILYRRGFRDQCSVHEFLDATPRHVPDPFALPDLDRATERIIQALHGSDRIAIYGDYDADGITATAILVRALRAAAGTPEQVIWRLPKRDEGYGLHRAPIDEVVARGASVLIAVDCGSTDHEHVAYAQSSGLDVIILDHHQMTDDGPAGAIVVSTQRAPHGTFAELTGAGLAYLLVSALAREGCRVDGDSGEPETHLLDLAAIGTIADVAPLTGVNRAFVRDGLRSIHQQARPSIRALCQQAGLDPAKVTAQDIAYRLAPRLNAAGRVADPHIAAELLLADDPATAEPIARRLEELNNLRKSESQRVVSEAASLLKRRPDLAALPLILLAQQNWPPGVLGIAAAKLADEYGKPVFVLGLTQDGTIAHGSGRSVPGFNITAALADCRELLLTYGGHEQAAGLTTHAANLPALTEALAAALPESEALPTAGLQIEADIPASEISLATAKLLAQLEPFGADNQAPLLRVRDLRVQRYTAVGREATHLSVHLGTGRGAVRAIAWGAASRGVELQRDPRIDILATLAVDEWGGNPRLQLELKDFRPSRN